MIYNQLIYGKDQTAGIVSIEVEKDHAKLFLNTGEVKEVPNKLWILSPTNLSNEFIRLSGNLYYKYGRQFSDRGEYHKWLNIYRSRNIDIFAVYNQKEALMLKDGYTYYKGLIPADVPTLSFDIETSGLLKNNSSKVYLITNTFRHGDRIVKRTFFYKDYNSCGEMISHWCEWVQEMNPAILLGHNIYSFDLPYLAYCADKYNRPLNLGRDGSTLSFARNESKKRYDGSRDLHYYKVTCYGREIIDTFFLAIDYDVQRSFESYALKSLIRQLGLEKPGRTFIDASKISANLADPEFMARLIQYAEEDSDDALKLFDLMIPATFYLANSIPKSFQAICESASGSQINSFLIRSYLQDGHSIPKADNLTGIRVEGGISFGVPGIYQNVLKIDLKSAYPSQILRFKLHDPLKDPKAHLYHMIKFFAEQRFEYKRLSKETGDKKWKDRDGAAKLFLNSTYGMTNTPGLHFNSPELAKKITRETRNVIDLSLQWASGKNAEHYMSTFGNKEFDHEEV